MLYSISNAMLKAGKTLGEKSAGWKHADAVIAILNNPKEFIAFSENLISLLHKYGKTIKEPFEVVRSEPNAQFILKEGMTKSFLSTAKGGEELTSFKRDSKDTLVAQVENGVDFVDVAELLQQEAGKIGREIYAKLNTFYSNEKQNSVGKNYREIFANIKPKKSCEIIEFIQSELKNVKEHNLIDSDVKATEQSTTTGNIVTQKQTNEQDRSKQDDIIPQQ